MAFERIDIQQREELRTACGHLFAASFIDDDFLRTLDLPMLKKAYRTRAKSCHPDYNPAQTPQLRQRFFDLHNSYNLLNFHLQSKQRLSADKPGAGSKIIAVGGAKGGIGKSVFATNLAVFLAVKGYKTVIVDLDLGGANQHLYLGQKVILKNNINDFLARRKESLTDVMVKSAYGPLLIGGDSSDFGALHLHFSRKLKLIKALRKLEADFVIVDLGGDINANILDFYLVADYGIVMTTRESASYIGAYHFVKAAILRKLNRLFGPESGPSGQRNGAFENFIRQVTMFGDESGIRTIADLLNEVTVRFPRHRSLVAEALAGFNPCLVVNKVPPGYDSGEIVGKLQNVAQKWLSREFSYLGDISGQRQIEQSVLDLVPVVARYPDGDMARQIGLIMGRLLKSAGYSFAV
ncbi:MAG: AAA family ATPase [Proteobacteria bacterium]|nr:AAA family ATPase [Pseudomonadota bacterium]MBU1714235.1 AAA family ATPase [Pseudomonadota bacterium]